MEYNVTYYKSTRNCARHNRHISSSPDGKEACYSSYSFAHAATLNQSELSVYLHGILSANLPYYKALAKYTEKPLRIPRNGQDYKKQKLLSRLTASGLSNLKTQFAKKPKNPV